MSRTASFLFQNGDQQHCIPIEAIRSSCTGFVHCLSAQRTAYRFASGRSNVRSGQCRHITSIPYVLRGNASANIYAMAPHGLQVILQMFANIVQTNSIVTQISDGHSPIKWHKPVSIINRQCRAMIVQCVLPATFV